MKIKDKAQFYTVTIAIAMMLFIAAWGACLV
jgi:hypothetical protein